MNRIALGSTGLHIHPLVFGTLSMGPLQADLSAAQGARLIRAALEGGVNLLDTAELYQTYPHIRQALVGYTGEVLIATKTHTRDAGEALRHVEKALRELGRDYLDIVLLHAMQTDDPFAERGPVLEVLLRLRDAGHIRHLGLSTHYITGVRGAMGCADLEVIHPLINREGLGIMDGSAAQMAAAIAQAAKAGKGVYAMKALGGGNLIAHARASLRYVQQLTGVHAVAIGMLSEQEILANLALLEGRPCSDNVWQPLESRRRRLKIMAPFCKGCGACLEACPAKALTVREGVARVDAERCVLCGYCAAACPHFLIRVL